MRAYFAIYYTGKTGSGSLSALFYDGEVVGLDAAASIIKGKFSGDFNSGLECDLEFHFDAGSPLVTGQTLNTPMAIPFSIKIPKAVLDGEVQMADFPTGKVNFRVELLKNLASSD